MKVGILAGGLGTRLAEETEIKPKPMVEIGGRPILWHIMKHYLHYGHNEFVIALGYKAEVIKKYMVDYCSLSSNITVDFKTRDIQTHDLNLGIGPAGTGKTYLAVACAVEALESEKVRRLVLVRPAVEAGERLGFLPGDLAQKIDPYLRPMHDALYEMLGFERVEKLMERNIIEVAPLAYMRGRTLNDAFIILDEAQNTTREQMKMFLTRIGFGSTAVVTGDVTQVDLPRDTQSGLRHAIDVLKDVDGVAMTFFNARDVVRHPLVQRIVNAYEKHEKND